MSGTVNNAENLVRDELIKLVGRQARLIERLQDRVSKLEAKLGEKSPTERLDEPCSQVTAVRKRTTVADKRGVRWPG